MQRNIKIGQRWQFFDGMIIEIVNIPSLSQYYLVKVVKSSPQGVDGLIGEQFWSAMNNELYFLLEGQEKPI